MGKDVHEDGGACCHACERWANTSEPGPAVTLPPLEVAAPASFAFEITKRGQPVMTYVPDRDEITIGRSDKNVLQLDGGALSKFQAVIVIRDGKVIVADRRSTCGTYVDGRHVGQPTRVHEGSVISFGDHDIKVVRRR